MWVPFRSHVKRIALGVPEDKWDALFDEIYRVMKPGAAFEVSRKSLDLMSYVLNHFLNVDAGRGSVLPWKTGRK